MQSNVAVSLEELYKKLSVGWLFGAYVHSRSTILNIHVAELCISGTSKLKFYFWPLSNFCHTFLYPLHSALPSLQGVGAKVFQKHLKLV